MRKIQDSFEYMAEASKCEFQYLVNGLLEFHGHYSDKITWAARNQKSGVFLSMEESELFAGFILKTAGDLMAHYNILNQCMLHLHKQQRITEAMLLATTPQVAETLLTPRVQQI